MPRNMLKWNAHRRHKLVLRISCDIPVLHKKLYKQQGVRLNGRNQNAATLNQLQTDCYIFPKVYILKPI
jgi:hypothetical protein